MQVSALGLDSVRPLVVGTRRSWSGPGPSSLGNYFFFLFAVCVNADAATDFTFPGVLGLLSNFDATVATFGDVFSFDCFFVAMCASFGVWLMVPTDF